jgi:hypothetical protein
MSDDNKTKLIEDFKINWLKYNLSCKKDESAEYAIPENQNFNEYEEMIMNKVKGILKNGSLHDKILLYYTINDNVNDLLTEILKLEKKISKNGKKNYTMSLCMVY